ncbi:MAG: metallophosphoesterase [Candidatus Hodarchaeota archaeon]
MRVLRALLVSDIHVDINSSLNSCFLSELEHQLVNLPPVDVVLLTGDVGHTIDTHRQAFRLIKHAISAQMFLYVPGNHDIWVGTKKEPEFDKIDQFSSWVKFNELLPQVCQEQGWYFLPGRPITLDEWGFAGTIGWYDFSTRNPKWDNKVSLEDYSMLAWEGRRYMDSIYALWGKSHPEMADYFNQQLVKDCIKLQELGIDRDKTIILTHHIPFRNAVHYFENDLNLDFFSAFMGCKKIGKIVIQNACYVVFGHTHLRNDFFEGDVHALCYPMGYFYHEEAKSLPLKEFIRRGLEIFTFRD